MTFINYATISESLAELEKNAQRLLYAEIGIMELLLTTW